ncbi:MAG: Phosphotransferase enzyme family, partial [Actinomycetota bacterium]|nr:Phosphotransferase enzyme family [Actinomycetota bacterium]
MSSPRSLVALGELLVTERRLVGREAQLWLVRCRDELAVLRRLDPALVPPTDESLRDRGWIHDFLTQLASTDFPAPRPLRVFEGSSVCVQSGAVWELLTFIEGDAVGWKADPKMEAIGELLARYHDAAAAIVVSEPRPTAVPPAEIHAALGADAGPAGIDTEVLARFRRHAVAFRELGGRRAHHDSLVIHGDFTNHNVIAAGTPLEPVGVIDFGLAHLEAPLADVGFGLWRSGRPRQDATSI